MLLRRLIVFGYPLIEILLLWLVANFIGWLAAIVLVIAGLPAGAALMRNAAAKYVTARDANETERPRIVRSSTGMFLAGLLIMIPGFLTDLLGVLLLIPPIQKFALSRVGAWTQARMVRVPGFMAYTYRGDVVQGTVVEGAVLDESFETQNDETQNEGEEPQGPSPEIMR